MRFSELVQAEIDGYVRDCNFLPLEKKIFLARCKGSTLEQCAEDFNYSVPAIRRHEKKIRAKIGKVMEFRKNK